MKNSLPLKIHHQPKIMPPIHKLRLKQRLLGSEPTQNQRLGISSSISAQNRASLKCELRVARISGFQKDDLVFVTVVEGSSGVELKREMEGLDA